MSLILFYYLTIQILLLKITTDTSKMDSEQEKSKIIEENGYVSNFLLMPWNQNYYTVQKKHLVYYLENLHYTAFI